jgi:holin-like protein
MPIAFLILVGCELIGDVLRRALHLPFPGPVIGMFLLALVLMVGGDSQATGVADKYSQLTRTANALISNMGLLFVPAGVGVIAEFGVLRQNWLPILVGLVVSTVLGLVVTGLVMHRLSREGQKSRPAPRLLAAYQEKRG